jgi:predicted ATPase/class 3 adenylate cyclase/DNA-binding CsgD family transcriptional regulator
VGTRAVSRTHDSTAPGQPALPTGTVTFVFTDVEGSTRLWQDHPMAMRSIMARHDTLIESAVRAHGGVVVRPRGEGDSRFGVFSQASAAVAAGCDMQIALTEEPWPLPRPMRVRIALHTGEADIRDGDYYGSDVNRCARLRSLAAGGQVLLSGTTAALARTSLPPDAALSDLGVYPLKDLDEPEHVYQLLHTRLPADFPAISSTSTPRLLPNEPTPLFARATELHNLEDVFRNPDVRLLTLVGAGGIGKTRLAIALAKQLASSFANGVWFVDLSSTYDPTLVLHTVARALGIQVAGSRTPLEHVQDYLRGYHAVLVLDNFEQVLDAAPDVARLLNECPDIKILATSREPLRLRWERAAPVRPLAVPGRQASDVEQLAQVPAVQFFVQRAQAADPEFALTAENASALAELCIRLDGLPLALELAAAHVRTFTPTTLASMLQRELQALRGTLDAPTRQQSLRATVEWSYDLLDTQEQQLFRRLAVFSGDCTLDSARAICQDVEAPDVLAAVESLVDKSLLQRERDADGRARFRMLETIRGVAIDKLEASPDHEAAQIRQRHAEHFLDLATSAEPESWGAQAGAWLDRLEREHDNLRGALNWLIAARRFDLAQTMASALEPLWFIRRHLTEGQHWLEAALQPPAACAAAQASPNRPTALVLLGAARGMSGDTNAAHTLALEAESEARRVGDSRQLFRVLWLSAEVARTRGDLEHAAACVEEAVELSRSEGMRLFEGVTLGLLGRVRFDQGRAREGHALSLQAFQILEGVDSPRGLQRLQQMLGMVALTTGDLPEARRLLEGSVANARALGDGWWLLGCLAYLAMTLVMEGELPRARLLLMECVELSRGQRDPLNAVRYLAAFAQLAAVQGQPERAVRLAAAADALRSRASLVAPRGLNRYVQAWLTEARATLGSRASQVWESGRWLSIEQATAYASSSDEVSPESSPLSAREREVARLLASGLSNREVAQQLVISERTAEAHVAHILTKLGLSTRLQIALWASEHETSLSGSTDAGGRGRS